MIASDSFVLRGGVHHEFPLCPPLSPGNLVEDKVTLISQKVQCHVYAVHLFIYISNKSKYLKTEMRYARAVKTNPCNFERSFKSFFLFIYPLSSLLLTTTMVRSQRRDYVRLQTHACACKHLAAMFSVTCATQ